MQPRLALTDLYGQALAQAPLSFDETTSHTDLLDLLQETTNKLLRSQQLSAEDLALLAVAAPGIVDLHAQTFYVNGFYANWDLPAICQELAQHFALEIFLYNDVNAAAWGEYIFRQATRENLVYVAGGSGLGLGLILNGELYLGSSGSAGEISEFLLTGLPPLGTGEYKSLKLGENTYLTLAGRASIRVLLRELNYQKQLEAGGELAPKPGLTYQDFLNLWKMGDAAAHRLAQNMGESLGVFLHNLSLILDIDLIILDLSYQPFIPYIAQSLKLLNQDSQRPRLEIALSSLGEQASLSGLADLAMETLLVRWAFEGGNA